MSAPRFEDQTLACLIFGAALFRSAIPASRKSPGRTSSCARSPCHRHGSPLWRVAVRFSTNCYVSIGGKNATLASLIEISYPAFVALFAFLLYREVHFNASVLLGAALVFAGVALIIVRSP